MTIKKEFLMDRQGKTLVLYAGLLDLAHQEGLKSIATEIVQLPTEANGNVAVVVATVTTEKGAFSEMGDANPANVNRMMIPHLLRMASTRAKARALRDAVNVGMAALEELGPDEQESAPRPAARRQPDPADDLRNAGAVVRESPSRQPVSLPLKPGPDGTPRQWFAFLSSKAREAGLARIPSIGPDDSDDAITDLNRSLKAALQGAK